MTKIKVGIIGCGSITKHRHLPEYLASERAEVIGLYNRTTSRAEELARPHELKVYETIDSLLNDPDIEAVSVNVPNAMHAEIAIRAMEAGKHVLVEKPMAVTEEECDAMIDAAEKAGVVLMVANNQRLVRSHTKARDYIASGRLGTVYSFRMTFGHEGPEDWSTSGPSSWFFQKDQAAMGVLGDLGVHKSDLIRYLFQDEIVEVGAFADTLAKKNSGVEDNAVCILRLRSGAIGTLSLSWSYTDKNDNSTVIYGEKGVLRLEDDETHAFIFIPVEGEQEKEVLGKIQTNAAGGQTTTCIIEEFLSSIVEKRAPLATGEDGKRALQVMLAAVKSYETKQIVQLEE